MHYDYEALAKTIEHLVTPGKGILALDESLNTIGKRFESIGIENNEKNRRDYRTLLCTTPELQQYIHGVIFFEETLTQTDHNGVPLPKVLASCGIIPGIKVDKGLVDLPESEDEKITQGLDGLSDRLEAYKALGARFAKWRNVYQISESTPSQVVIKTGASLLARYACLCQAAGMVPIVEPEILIEGEHSLEEASEVAEVVLHELFHEMFLHQVVLEGIILKASMVTPGKSCAQQSTPEEIAEATLSAFSNVVPASVASIHFLSGGQTPVDATTHLNAINRVRHSPWNLSFSFARALQDPCLKAWRGNPENINSAQLALLNRARLNSLASLGEYAGE